MSEPNQRRAPKDGIARLLLPFADVATDDLPLSRLLRLSLFQVSVGMTMVLLTGTLNRVMIVELSVPASLVAAMVSLPLLFAPARALLGHRSDHQFSALGWKRGLYILFGSFVQFGGLAIMPFALLVLSGQGTGPVLAGQVGAALAFLMIGAGMHTVQTAGLALAADIAPEKDRPRVVALLYVMLLIGMMLSALIFGSLLADFTPTRLIQVIQGSALVVLFLNAAALWKQESRPNETAERPMSRPPFLAAFRRFIAIDGAKRLLWATGLGSAAFAMQDILLEPYGGEVLGLSVRGTTFLTALFAAGTLLGFAFSGRRLSGGGEPHRLAGLGILIGVIAFSSIVFAHPLNSAAVFLVGVFLIGFGGGLFSVSMLTSVMSLAQETQNGIALGVWGAVQAGAVGIAVAVGGGMRDVVSSIAATGALGPALSDTSIGYSTVYHVEILLLFTTLAVVGPLARHRLRPEIRPPARLTLTAFPQ